MRGVARRQQFIEVALHLFATRGFRGTTTRAIAEAAGVSEAMLFRHFPTKSDLYQAILHHRTTQDDIDRMLVTLRHSMQVKDDGAVVLQLAGRILESYRQDRDFERVMLLAALEGHDLASLSRQTIGLPVFTLLREYVALRQAEGAFRPGDPALHALALVALPVYFGIVTSLFEIDLGAPADTKTAAAFAEMILDGLRPRQSGSPRAAGGDSAGTSSRTASGARRRRRHS